MPKRYKSKLTDYLRFLGLPRTYSYMELDPFEGTRNGKEGEGYDSDGSSDTVSAGTIPYTSTFGIVGTVEVMCLATEAPICLH